MENEKKATEEKGFKYIFKKYGYYFALTGLLAILSLAIILTGVNAGAEETEATNSGTISFELPVLNGTVAKGFNVTDLQYNAVLDVWETHKGVDFVAEIGTNVLAVYDGTVLSVGTDILEGTVVVIDHGNGLKTSYGSLSETTNVKVGDVVKQGDIIGTVSNSAISEVDENGEVHFEVWKDGAVVDPANYMDISTGK